MRRAFITLSPLLVNALVKQRSKRLIQLLGVPLIKPLVRPFSSINSTNNPPVRAMPPIGLSFQYKKLIDETIETNRAVIFGEPSSEEVTKIKEIFDQLGSDYHVFGIDTVADPQTFNDLLQSKAPHGRIPLVFAMGKPIGGYEDVVKSFESGDLGRLLKPHPYDYDLIVIGGGSGGLAASKEAARLGQKVSLLDFVTPSPIGTTWGLGGTCVNVGCIPKKLMHQSALVAETLHVAYEWGFAEERLALNHFWNRLVQNIQNVVKGSNFTYRVALRNSNVKYINAYGTFEDEHKIKLTDKSGNESYLTSNNFLIATGERPRYPDIPGVIEYCITSDDLFSLPYHPQKTLVVGASYVALECAGFLRSLGVDVTVMVRSVLLRGFDSEMAEKVGQYMQDEIKVKFLRPCVPLEIEERTPRSQTQAGVLGVKAQLTDEGTIFTEEFNTVIFAVGRKPCTDKIGLDKIGVEVDKRGKIPCVNEQTNVPNVYAVGDIVQDKPELTPVAIKAGILLARRLAGVSDELCDYSSVATTVFTPLEYGCCGLSEEKAIELYGEENIEVYVQHFTPTEWSVAQKPKNICYAKVITLLTENERILGFHYLGPNAGEVTQFTSLALKKNCTKAELDSMIGIHPTNAEVFVYLTVTKRSGKSSLQAGCCG
uniref:thioredoxin-disulfide reductase (NADPH) n=1 Tax=Tetranychus truncatus TaxID=93132 RepID=A0A3G5AQG8_9ACAR|nr:Thioredoxin reductase [Tetranychus truncatus]